MDTDKFKSNAPKCAWRVGKWQRKKWCAVVRSRLASRDGIKPDAYDAVMDETRADDDRPIKIFITPMMVQDTHPTIFAQTASPT